MQKVSAYLRIDMAIFYITKDPERATGVEDLLENYHVICPHPSTTTEVLKKNGVSVLVLDQDIEGGTYGILRLPTVQNYIKEHASPTAGQAANILLLKTSTLIERVCSEQKWNLWAPKANVAKKYEDKVSQYNALAGIVPFPSSQITTIRDIQMDTYPYILQFNTGHSGEGTHVIENAKQLERLQEKFPDRDVRVSHYIHGKTYTLNALVTKSGDIYTGSISLQLTGLPEATNNPAATVGNDFGAARELPQDQVDAIRDITKNTGHAMARDGYVGLFGIDVIVAEAGVFFVEVNTHQPASISFEAVLHRSINTTPLMLIFIRDMMGEERLPASLPRGKADLPPIIFPYPASQIIYRNKQKESISRSLISLPPSDNILPARTNIVKPEEELFRIQSYSSTSSP